MPQINQIAIIGFGLMGAQIAQVFSEASYDIFVYDSKPGQVALGLDLIQKGRFGLDNSVLKGRITKESSETAFNRIKQCETIEDASKNADIVLEAAYEDLEIKKDIFRKAGKAAGEDTIFATNTSTMSITKIGQDLPLGFRARFAGLHFFNPPQVMKLVEIVKTTLTQTSVITTLQDFCASISKTAVVVFDSPGFVANRIGLAVFAEASSLLDRNVATVRDIDLAMRLGYGYPMGPFELGDLVGLDSRLRNMEAMHKETGDERFKPPEILQKLVIEGFIGDPKLKKGSKGGYYEYYGLKRPSEVKQQK